MDDRMTQCCSPHMLPAYPSILDAVRPTPMESSALIRTRSSPNPLRPQEEGILAVLLNLSCQQVAASNPASLSPSLPTVHACTRDLSLPLVLGALRPPDLLTPWCIYVSTRIGITQKRPWGRAGCLE
jgi:hypothetical protein